MVLLLSIDGDTSTDHVIGWLQYFEYPYRRLNVYDLVRKEVFIDVKDNHVYIGDSVFDFNTVKAVWYRKSRFYKESAHCEAVKRYIDYDSANNLSTEFYTVYDFILSMLSDKVWLTHPSSCNLNKLKVLKMASTIGLHTPASFIVSSKQKLGEIGNSVDVVVKSVYNPRPIEKGDESYLMFTSRIAAREIDDLPSRFFPSFVQSEIKKRFEIRTFFLIDKFYSMAMFSQQNRKTEVDVRKYDWENPIRNVPYQLPADVERKLKELLRQLNLNCASVDLIKGCDGNYYFLEINPNGQFGNVDASCNYGIHKQIAETLIAFDKR